MKRNVGRLRRKAGKAERRNGTAVKAGMAKGGTGRAVKTGKVERRNSTGGEGGQGGKEELHGRRRRAWRKGDEQVKRDVRTSQVEGG